MVNENSARWDGISRNFLQWKQLLRGDLQMSPNVLPQHNKEINKYCKKTETALTFTEHWSVAFVFCNCFKLT